MNRLESVLLRQGCLRIDPLLAFDFDFEADIDLFSEADCNANYGEMNSDIAFLRHSIIYPSQTK